MTEETKNKGGRPTKYCDGILEKAKQYLYTYETLGHAIPSVEGLALHLDIDRSTIYDWASQEDKEEFSYTLSKINITQKHVLLTKGLLSEFNSNICKLALGNHGFSDKQQSEVSGRDGKPIENKWTVEFVEATKDSEKDTDET